MNVQDCKQCEHCVDLSEVDYQHMYCKLSYGLVSYNPKLKIYTTKDTVCNAKQTEKEVISQVKSAMPFVRVSH